MEGEVVVRHPKNWGLDEKIVLRIAREVLKKIGGKSKVELSLFFVGRKRAKDLNLKYRNKNYIPQVLSFPLSKEIDKDGVIYLGDVVICSQKLKYETKFSKKDVKVVLREWMEHGVENLLV